MKPMILKTTAEQEFYTAERCHILECSNLPEDPEVSIAQARVEPGVTTRWHRLKDTTERYYILSGCGQMEVGDLPPQEVSAGDVVRIPPNCRQRMTNLGSDDLLFLAICSPRFVPEAYEDIADAGPEGRPEGSVP